MQVFIYTIMGIKLKSVPLVQKVCERGHCFDDDGDDDDEEEENASLESESGLFITLGNGTFGDQNENPRTLSTTNMYVGGISPISGENGFGNQF